MNSFEAFFWGKNQGYSYRRFTSVKINLEILQTIRAVFMLILGTFLVLRFTYGPPLEQFIYMTTWGSYFCFFSLLLNFIATEDQKKHSGTVFGWEFWRWRNAVWLFEMTVSFDVMITIMYWGFEYKYTPDRDFNFYYNIFIHIFPLVFNLFDLFAANWWFRLQHLITPFIVGITYGILY